MIRYRLRQRLSDGSLWTSAVIFEAATPRHVAQAVIAGFLSGEPRWAIERRLARVPVRAGREGAADEGGSIMTYPEDESDLIGKTIVEVRRDACVCKPSRWFLCQCPDLEVCEYEVATFDTVPDRVQLQWIRDQHPGCVLIYLDPTEAR
jgi:hypothetical protein